MKSPCEECQGTGVLEIGGDSNKKHWSECPHCDGAGEVEAIE